MSSANPITRSTRRRDLDATAGQTVFTLDVPVYDLADVDVFTKKATDLFWIPVTSGVTLTFIAGNQVQATFAVAPRPTVGDPVTTVRLQSARVQERITNATRGGTVASALLEADLDRISTVLQELRRDIDDASAERPAIAGNVFSASSDPALRPDGSALQAGDLYFNTASQVMRIYSGSAWSNLASPANSSFRTYAETSTTAKTTFTITGGYTVNLILVYLNGVLLEPSEFTASNGTTVVLGANCAVSDEFRAVMFDAFTVADAVGKTGDTMTGELSAPGFRANVDAALASNYFLNNPLAVPRWNLTRESTGGRFEVRRYDTSGVYQSSPIIVDPGNGFVGINGLAAPARALDVSGDIGVTGTVVAPAIVGNSFNGGPVSGFKNRIINPRMENAQRGTSGSILTAGNTYMVDRWAASATGAALPWLQGGGGPLAGEYASNTVGISGAAGNTFFRVFQRIESVNARDLAGKTVTFSVYVLQVSGASRNILIYLNHANAPNNFTTFTAIGNNGAGVALANNTWARVSWTVTLPATGPENGLSIEFDLSGGGLVAGQSFNFWGAQLEIGDRPTPLEFRHFSTEQQLCRRYFRQHQFWVPATTAQNLGVIDMRATPTITGGGAGFTSTGTVASQLIAFQTTGALQTLTLDAEIA
jgi:hypothetical protein